MKRVTGIGGIFFTAKNAPELQAWYKRHLGIDVQEWGGTAFMWADSDGKPTGGTTVWSVSPETSDQFDPSKAFHDQLSRRRPSRSGHGAQNGRLQRPRQNG